MRKRIINSTFFNNIHLALSGSVGFRDKANYSFQVRLLWTRWTIIQRMINWRIGRMGKFHGGCEEGGKEGGMWSILPAAEGS